jgi:hypothetical protein
MIAERILVPVDFGRSSDVALYYGKKIAALTVRAMTRAINGVSAGTDATDSAPS